MIAAAKAEVVLYDARGCLTCQGRVNKFCFLYFRQIIDSMAL